MPHGQMETVLDGLNAAQRDAVTSSAPVLQVLAPPGSGKTKTLTARVAYLLAHHGYAPWNVICCTFTIKASREMRERLRGIIGAQLESKLILGTFHSICRRYLVTYGYLIGIPKDFGIADSSDTLALLKRIIKRLNLNTDPKSARSRISHRKARGLREDELYKSMQKNVENQELATIYQEYQKALSASSLLDYDDLLLRCTELLRAQPQCVSNVEALLIDEFQDTNVVQYELMKLLASKNNCITIVGDPDQSIYGFRSAESENLRRMKAYYSDTLVINLEENYRSSSAVLQIAQDLIEQDTTRPQKKLKATHSYGTFPVLRKLPTAFDEANWLVSEIRRATAMTGGLLGFSDFAILLRSAHLSRLIEVALGKVGMPYRMVGGHRFFDREEIRILLDYLRTISQPNNNAALAAIINIPSRKIGEETVKELLRVGEEKGLSLWAIVQKAIRGDVALQKKLSKPAEQDLSKLVKLILDSRQKMLGMIPDHTPRELLDVVITRLSFKNWLQSKHPEDHENRWANVEELMTQAGDLAAQRTLSTNTNFDEELPVIGGLEQQKLEGSEEVLARFLASISLSADLQAPEDGTEKQCITISTIHAAKGLEWPVVFIPAVYEGSIPHSRAEDTDEERRLLYVAMTRAQALLYLSVPRCQSRDNAETTLSQFLPGTLRGRFSELGPDFTDKAVEVISGILRRPEPSQEQLISSIQNMPAGDSMKDDHWPSDGTSRAVQHWNNDAAQPAQRLPGPRSISATGKRTFGQQVNVTQGSHSSDPIGFTTAGQHLKSHPTHLESINHKSSDPGSVRPQKKIRGGKCRNLISGPTQASLSTFLASGSFKEDASQDAGSAITTTSGFHQCFLEPRSPILPPIRNASSIPPEYLSHAISSTSTVLKRPRPVLEETAPNRKRYHQFSSSPTREEEPSSIGAKPYEEKMKGETSSDCTKSVTGTTTMKLSYQSYSTSLGRPATTMHTHTTSMAMLQQNTIGRKTYGARRTLNNGWDSRKHK